MNEQLLPFYILYKLSQADKKPQEMTEQGILNFLQENQDDPITKQAISEFASGDVTEDEGFADFMGGIQEKKSGGKIEYLKKLSQNMNTDFFKKGGKMKKKCKCGCNMVSFKDKGGKIVDKCACGCKAEGGKTEIVVKPAPALKNGDVIKKLKKKNCK